MILFDFECLSDGWAKPEQILFTVHTKIRSNIIMPWDSILRQKINYERRKHKLAEPKDLDDIDLSLKPKNKSKFMILNCSKFQHVLNLTAPILFIIKPLK